jgi:hypothetical protein
MEPAATRGVDDLESVRTDCAYVNDMLAELDIYRLLRHWIPPAVAAIPPDPASRAG